jgi:hypothetical protein
MLRLIYRRLARIRLGLSLVWLERKANVYHRRMTPDAITPIAIALLTFAYNGCEHCSLSRIDQR